MAHGPSIMHRPAPDDPGVAWGYFSLIAAAGFAFGWAAQALGAF